MSMIRSCILSCAVLMILSACTILYQTPGGMLVMVHYPSNQPHITSTPTPGQGSPPPTLTPSPTVMIHATSTPVTIDPTPTIVHEPSPTVTATFHFTDADNYTVYTTTRLNLRRSVNGTIIRVLNTGTPLEVQIGVSVELPSPWLYVIDTSDGQPGFVSGVWVDVRPPMP